MIEKRKFDKCIWIINQYTSTPILGGGGNRSFHIASELYKLGYNLTLITASYSHVPKRNYPIKNQFHFEKEQGIDLVIIKNIVYHNGRSFLRILSMVIFWLKLYFLPLRKIQAPDFIIVSSISLLPILNAFFFKKKFNNKPKIILEIRDIWPLSLIELGGFSMNNPFVRFLSWVEKSGYKKSDYVTSVLPLAYKHIDMVANKKVSFKHIPNGIHLKHIQSHEPLSKEISELIPSDKFIIGYTGALGVANAMNYFIDLAIYNKSNTKYYFVIVGDGYLKKKLAKLAKGLDNILFFDRIPKQQIQSILSKFDLLFLGAENKDLYKYGVSANKIYDYMYASKPILMMGNIDDTDIEQSNCGKVIKSYDILEANEAVNYFYNISEEDRLLYGLRGKEFVIKYRTYEYLSKMYSEIFNKLSH